MSRLSRAVRKMLGIKRRHTRGSPAPAASRVPDFFICGAARSGTTSLWEYLRQHPEIYMPANIGDKEPSYFCDLYGMTDWQAYVSLFRDAGNKKRVGEASGPYLTSPESPGLIKAVVPNARIIISLRNPVERAWSLYKWMRANGYEKAGTFAEALEAEDKCRVGNVEFIRNNGQYYHNFLYFHSGLYHDHVKRFFDVFGRGSVHVQIFEDFVRTPIEHMRRIFSFLDVDPSFSPIIEKHNPSEPIPIDKALRERLRMRYDDDMGRLAKLLGRNLTATWL